MPNELNHRINIRLDNITYGLLETVAAKRGETISFVARKILSRNLQSEVALDAQDVLLTAVRKAVSLELRKTENRLASLSSKTAISSASTENLVTYVLKLLNEPRFKEIRTECRKRGVAFVREPLDQIMLAYGEKETEESIIDK